MPRKPTKSTSELGSPGLEVYHGYVSEEKHPRLSGKRAMEAYEEMSLNDPIVGASLYAIESYLRKVRYTVRPPDESGPATEVAGFVKSCLDDMDQPWGDFVSDAMSMVVYGFSLHEVVYKYRRGLGESNKRFRSKHSDGRIGWRALAPRSQKTIERWDVDESTGEILGCWQLAPPLWKDVYLPMSRCVLFRTRSYKNNPEGASVLRRAYRPWYMKKHLEEIEAIGIARDANGVPKVSVPQEIMSPTATPAQRQTRAQMQRMVSLLAKDQLEGVVFPSEFNQQGGPSGYKLELMSSQGGKNQMAHLPIQRYDSRIAMSFAAEFLFMGTEKTGSFAAASEHSGHFTRSLEWYSDIICDQFNKVLIPRLMEVNNIAPELWPKLEHSPVQEPDLKSLGLFLQQVATAGLLTATPQLESHLRVTSQMPEPTQDEMALMQTRIEAAQTAATGNKPPAPEPTDPETETPTEE